jgi:hypothetical protein
MKEITYHYPGERAEDLRLGDFLLTRSENWYGKAIRFGQWFNSRRNVGVNHAVLCAGGSRISEATADGIVPGLIDKYDDQYYAIVRMEVPQHDAEQIAKYINYSETGRVKYGWLTIASLAMTMGAGSQINFGVNGTLICSGYVAMALLRAGEVFDVDANFVTPADLAVKYSVFLRI